MDLICNEKEMLKECHQNNDKYRHYHNNHVHNSLHNGQINTASADPTFLSERCLENLLKCDEIHSTVNFYCLHSEITPKMRRIVAEWMMEVCEENKCQEEVFILALNYMDRFLALTQVGKRHLQILAAACLLLASKLREPSIRGLPAELLVFYTDNSITTKELIQWELIVLSKLKWNISSVTPLDFLEHLLARLPVNNQHTDISKIKKHAQAFISLAAREHQFSIYSARTTAASSIAASLYGMHWHLHAGISMSRLLDMLKDLTGVERHYLQNCMEKLEKLFEQHKQLCYNVDMNEENSPVTDENEERTTHLLSDTNNNNNNISNSDTVIDSNKISDTNKSRRNCKNNKSSKEHSNGQANRRTRSKSHSATPTDVQDVKL